LFNKRSKRRRADKYPTFGSYPLPPEIEEFMEEFEKLLMEFLSITSLELKHDLYQREISLDKSRTYAIKDSADSNNEQEDVDILADDDKIIVVTSVNPHIKSVIPKVDGYRLKLLAGGKPYKIINLPTKVNKEIANVSLRNGVLTIELNKEKRSFHS